MVLALPPVLLVWVLWAKPPKHLTQQDCVLEAGLTDYPNYLPKALMAQRGIRRLGAKGRHLCLRAGDATLLPNLSSMDLNTEKWSFKRLMLYYLIIRCPPLSGGRNQTLGGLYARQAFSHRAVAQALYHIIFSSAHSPPWVCLALPTRPNHLSVCLSI